MVPMADADAAADPEMAPNEHIGDYIDKCQTSGETSDKDPGKVYQSEGNASRIHDITCQNEKWYGQKCKTVKSRGHSLGKRRKGRK